MISDNYKIIMKNIDDACTKSDFKEEVCVVGVTKTVSADNIKCLYDQGIRIFGENKVQELLPKIEILPNDIKWHFIGTLQSNKVKQIVGKVDLIQSVDSFKLIDEINKCAEKLEIIQNILLEVNIGLEDSKSGITPDSINEFVEYIKTKNNILLQGLMCIPPRNVNNVENVDNFRKMRKLFIDNKDKYSHNIHMNILSMGMSSDYEDAIIMGSTMVRIGQAFFGKRNNK